MLARRRMFVRSTITIFCVLASSITFMPLSYDKLKLIIVYNSTLLNHGLYGEWFHI